MEVSEALRRLELFGIPEGVGDEATAARALLARFLASGAISLAECQTARDIVGRRQVADPWAYAFVAVMFLSVHGGNAFLKPERIPGLVEAAGFIEDEAGESAEEFKNSIPAAVRKTQAAADALDGDVVVNDGDRWFFKKNHTAVMAIREEVRKRMGAPGEGCGFVGVTLSGDELRTAVTFTSRRTGEAYMLNDEQKSAVAKVAGQRLTVVTGGPGTGKTTVVCSFLRALFSRNAIEPIDVALAAPTGRAGQRMSEAIRKQCAEFGDERDLIRQKIESLKGQTVHSLLGGFPPDWKYTADNRLPQKLVIVDEASMVDIKLMQALLAALNDDCRLVLLGDGDQLPSVDTGAVLGDLVGSVGEGLVVHLATSNRFRGKLADCARVINGKGLDEDVRWRDFAAAATSAALQPAEVWTLPLTQKETEDSCFMAKLQEAKKPDDCHALVVKWAETFGLLKEGEGNVLTLARNFPRDDVALTEGKCSPAARMLFDALDRSRILTVVREGAYGVKGINELLVKKCHGGHSPANPYAMAGVPVLVTRNTRERALFNGDIGITVKGKNGMVALFPRGDEVIACPVDLLPEHDLAYAITVHKSQGSEFDNVLVLLPDQIENPLLSRPLVYTGITRAKKRAVVMGTEKAIKKALSTAVDRDTGISV